MLNEPATSAVVETEQHDPVLALFDEIADRTPFEATPLFAFISGAQADYDQLRTGVDALEAKVEIGPRELSLVPLIIKDAVGTQGLLNIASDGTDAAARLAGE